EANAIYRFRSVSEGAPVSALVAAVRQLHSDLAELCAALPRSAVFKCPRAVAILELNPRWRPSDRLAAIRLAASERVPLPHLGPSHRSTEGRHGVELRHSLCVLTERSRRKRSFG